MPNIFSRFTEIISSNINALLDKAEDPKKMIKLIILEMEDALVEIKAACAQAMAEEVHQGKRRRDLAEALQLWETRARAAAAKNRDDLALLALSEKRKISQELQVLEEDGEALAKLIEKYHDEIEQLDAKIRQARDKDRLLALRQEQAQKSLLVSKRMKDYDLNAAKLKLSALDRRLETLEAEATIAKNLRTSSEDPDVEAEFRKLDDSLEAELLELKKGLAK
ncbi:MAG: PspA/IM30 family protein [Deltaproteobacteria bacterium]|jgi:phage shock protein A|nr:PspA/IM30 family protein [Deltaproteobacteria bacterium]